MHAFGYFPFVCISSSDLCRVTSAYLRPCSGAEAVIIHCAVHVAGGRTCGGGCLYLRLVHSFHLGLQQQPTEEGGDAQQLWLGGFE